MPTRRLPISRKSASGSVWPDDDFPRTSTQKPKLELIRRAAEIQVNGSGTASVTTTSSHSGDGTLEEMIGNIAGRRVELKPGAHLENDLNLSSLDRVELMAAIEDRFST